MANLEMRGRAFYQFVFWRESARVGPSPYFRIAYRLAYRDSLIYVQIAISSSDELSVSANLA